MEESKKVFSTALVILLVLAVAVAFYYLVIAKRGGEEDQAGLEKIPAEKAAVSKDEDIPVFPPTPLDDSDTLVRRLATELSSHPMLDSWVRGENLVRKFVAAVDNIANGESPTRQVDFFAPQGAFKVVQRGNSFYIDPSSYDRYNLAAEVFISLDARDCIRFYKGLRNVFQEAYRDLGYPEGDFDATFKRALLELLAAPVVEGDIRVERKVKTYMFADSRLERLSPAQKHFLRMGPRSVEAVQIKLREMAVALGVPELSIPRARLVASQ